MGGQRPNQGKSTSYHLTPSLLEDVLNEKKMVNKTIYFLFSQLILTTEIPLKTYICYSYHKKCCNLNLSSILFL